MDRLLTPSGGGTHLLLGNEAVARGALEAGLAFLACYPGTPSSEVPDTLYRLKRESPGEAQYYIEYSTNEKVALEAAAGAAVAGLRAMCTMKHVGLNVAADPLMTLAYTGVRGGMVVYVCDDPSLFSSQNEQDSRYYARLGGLPMLEAATPAELCAMTSFAFELSEELATPVILRSTTRVSHARQAVTFQDLKPPKTKVVFQKDPFNLVTVPAVSRRLHLRLLQANDRAREIGETSPFNRVSGRGRLGVLTSGVAASFVSDAVAELGLADRVKVLRLGLSCPCPKGSWPASWGRWTRSWWWRNWSRFWKTRRGPWSRRRAWPWPSWASSPSTPDSRWTWPRPPSSAGPSSTTRAWCARPWPASPESRPSLASRWIPPTCRRCRAGRRTSVRAAPTGPPITRSGRCWATRRSTPTTSAATPGLHAPLQGGRLPDLHGLLHRQRLRLLPGAGQAGGGLHRRLHLLPLRPHRPGQRGPPPPQPDPGDPGQRHHRHDRQQPNPGWTPRSWASP